MPLRPQPSRVQPDQPAKSRAGKWIGLALGLIPLLFFGVDFYHSVTKTGLYRPNWSGTVVSAHPTLLSVVDFFFSTSNRRSNSWGSSSSYSYYDYNRGHYSATITTDDGTTLTVGLSNRDYNATSIPSYIVSKGGSVSHFPSHDAAVAAHAVP